MSATAPGCWALSVALPPGRAAFKFVVDGVWCASDAYETVPDGVDGVNNIVDVQVLSAKEEEKKKQKKHESGKEAKDETTAEKVTDDNPNPKDDSTARGERKAGCAMT
jgi:Glycogen recognition site of AMP-activated protein kinase